MNKIKIGIIGIGSMGSQYVSMFEKEEVMNAVLTAVCTKNENSGRWVREQIGDSIQVFHDEEDFFHDADIDGVIITRPHYDHPGLAKYALNKGLHVLTEKPAGVYTKNVLEMNKAAKVSGRVFGIMYNQRTNPVYQKVRELVQSHELGDIKRMNWTVTHWYRSQSYYDSSVWRATWSGEGGGVLLNQSPHQLDLWQWTTGLMPKRIRAFNAYGKYHDIEVEDESTIYAEYENGATGLFVTSTGEAPGTNRFEIVGNNGKLVIENDEKLTFYRLRRSEREFNATYKGGMGKPECWKIDIPVHGESTGHLGIIQNWINGIKKGTPLLAPGEEGIKGLEISNAAYLSSWLNQTVELPVNPDVFYEHLCTKIKESKRK
ncbi:Gfo/Idh/MocA family oxidoreductase [Virgibacillus sp. NKC19-3]|uniref:Gfo/Idh/MocA family protein n=1 Tax=Virgibacillus saliphilus TaxID=2831674 RepID=UPI001C9A5A93|nr:Gfo/Idh/MocA family oxidoreductase [Virgibacillus sp. NKC19-3]MBY7142294.1 Gfo/Idh/MocA family oxidoreductase [Virgibacillus sp. NKC19-3]